MTLSALENHKWCAGLLSTFYFVLLQIIPITSMETFPFDFFLNVFLLMNPLNDNIFVANKILLVDIQL